MVNERYDVPTLLVWQSLAACHTVCAPYLKETCRVTCLHWMLGHASRLELLAARYGLVRVRENAESIAFYGGEASEQRLLWQRLSAVIKNYAQLLSTSRNLEFFTSSYRQGRMHGLLLHTCSCTCCCPLGLALCASSYTHRQLIVCLHSNALLLVLFA